ncbi:hypothetical protein FA95DRAFT_1613190 [Auriscalpium vulgare]|uniref:Uncharacterized protein n=1 Tax=Auriscalpium vulgare TaxID=40419 RepID=A0ACB8R448_9AGAM|nr:hypothetical protein FA95DRAFT_1613190 [Auriscalpium vulgare]
MRLHGLWHARARKHPRLERRRASGCFRAQDRCGRGGRRAGPTVHESASTAGSLDAGRARRISGLPREDAVARQHGARSTDGAVRREDGPGPSVRACAGAHLGQPPLHRSSNGAVALGGAACSSRGGECESEDGAALGVANTLRVRWRCASSRGALHRQAAILTMVSVGPGAAASGRWVLNARRILSGLELCKDVARRAAHSTEDAVRVERALAASRASSLCRVRALLRAQDGGRRVGRTPAVFVRARGRPTALHDGGIFRREASTGKLITAWARLLWDRRLPVIMVSSDELETFAGRGRGGAAETAGSFVEKDAVHRQADILMSGMSRRGSCEQDQSPSAAFRLASRRVVGCAGLGGLSVGPEQLCGGMDQETSYTSAKRCTYICGAYIGVDGIGACMSLSGLRIWDAGARSVLAATIERSSDYMRAAARALERGTGRAPYRLRCRAGDVRVYNVALRQRNGVCASDDESMMRFGRALCAPADASRARRPTPRRKPPAICIAVHNPHASLD